MAVARTTRKIQLGLETTPGTAVAATTIWRGQGTIKDLIEVNHVPENIGAVVPTNRTYIPVLGAELTMAEVPATFEQLPYLGAAGIKNVTSGSASGSAYVYAYTMPASITASKNTISTYTIEAGDSQQEEEMEYAFVREFKITGEHGQAVRMSAVWEGRQVAASTYTGSLSLPTVETILFQKSKLYIDAAGGTIGTTVKSSTLVSFALSVTTGWKKLPTGSGTLYFDSIDFSDPNVELDITFIHDSTATAGKTAWRAETGQLIRVQLLGSQIQTSGTYTNKTVNLDLAGKWVSFESLGERDGLEIITGKFKAMLDTTASLYFNMTVANTLSALP